MFRFIRNIHALVQNEVRKMNPKPAFSANHLMSPDVLEANKGAPVIDRCYPLSDVAEAVKYLLKGHPRGKVVITVASSAQ